VCLLRAFYRGRCQRQHQHVVLGIVINVDVFVVPAADDDDAATRPTTTTTTTARCDRCKLAVINHNKRRLPS